MSQTGPTIAVIGSINMDLVVRCAKLPEPGETLLAESSSEICGGKGANQAVAAARAGGKVRMVGRVGADAFADRLISNLERAEICTEHVQRTADCASGLAVVAVENSGQNSIMVVPGANGLVTEDDIRRAQAVIEGSQVVLLQLEIPLPAILAAIQIAKAADVRVILDPAPAPNDWPSELLHVDLLCPNESEAATILGQQVQTVEQAEAAARALCDRGASNVAVTLGSRGTALNAGGHPQLVEPFPVEVCDTTAAGDAFAGALAVYWAEKDDLAEAVRFGSAAGALAASRPGAQPSMASRVEIEALGRSA